MQFQSADVQLKPAVAVAVVADIDTAVAYAFAASLKIVVVAAAAAYLGDIVTWANLLLLTKNQNNVFTTKYSTDEHNVKNENSFVICEHYCARITTQSD